MRRRWIGLLLAAGCGLPGPREELVLFESPEARVRRDLHALSYSESDEGILTSIVIPRTGAAECRAEFPQHFVDALRRVDARIDPRMRFDVPVDQAQRETIETFFAGLPAGASEQVLVKDVKADPSGKVTLPAEVFTGTTKVRVLHLSNRGEVKTLTYTKGFAEDLPAGVPPGGAALEALDKLFLSLVHLDRRLPK